MTNEICGDTVHSIADCGIFGEKFVYHNDIPVAAAVHNVHCLQVDPDRLKRVRQDQLDLEVTEEQERLQKLKRKLCPNIPVPFPDDGHGLGMLEIDRAEVAWKYSKKEMKSEYWGETKDNEDCLQVPKILFREGNQVRQEWNLGV